MTKPDTNDIPVVYANWFAASPSPFELALDFGYHAADIERPRPNVRIVSTWEHAKLLKEVLDQVIEIREGNVGEIGRPPGVELNEPAATTAEED
jgi:hypothetical protein